LSIDPAVNSPTKAFVTMGERRASVPFNPAMMQKEDEKDHWLFEKSRPPFGDVFGVYHSYVLSALSKINAFNLMIYM
jgi:hypothetical protein